MMVIGLWSQALFADPVIRVSNEGSVQRYIGDKVLIFQDSDQTVTPAELLASSALFQRSETAVPNLGVSNHVNWIKFTVYNDADYAQLVLTITNPTVAEITLFTLYNGERDSTSISERDTYDNRDYNHQFYAFDLHVAKGDSIVCLLRLKSSTQLLVPLSIRSSETVVRELAGFDFRSGTYIGLMVAMLLYNLFLYVSARDRHYLAYVHYIFWVAIAQITVLGYFGRMFQGVPISSSYVLAFVGAMSGIASVIFVKSFLSTKDYGKKINFLLNLIIAGDLLAIAVLLFGAPTMSYEVVNFVAGVGSFIVLAVGYVIYRKGNHSARLFLVAWGIFLGSVIVFVLKDYGILEYSLFTVHAVQIGSSIEALLLSFALGDKINIYRKQKEESQLKAIEIAKENERLIREQNVVLERRVEERTHALKESNDSLQQTLTHLKETQSQLVEAEKMASLGQLTAGVAHEINNPINFVTSNVAPLKRDVGMVWDAMEEVERIALADDVPADEKRRRIEAYKEDIDAEYLKTEIDFLLKGMHEGATRTAEIVKSLRIFSRVDEDSLKFADINEGLESTLVILNSVIKEGVTVVKELGELPLVECYPGKLNQVFLNIITNGIYAINKKFEGKPGGILEIKTTVDKEHAYISIRDNGVGMPDEVKEKIFEPFFTTKEVGEGTGLGMSIVYNTIRKHQGEIKVESTVGEGVAFLIIIPLNQHIQ